MKRRAYRATDVKDVRLEEVLKRAPAGAVTAGADIGKQAIYSVVRWSDGSFERPWKAKNPEEVATLVGILRALANRRELIVAMESTGSYGEPLRSKLAEAGLTVHRVGGKAAHDYAEVFDGVPSQHDGKDAAVIAELAAFGKATPWPFRAKSEWEAEMASWVDWLDIQQNFQRMWIGRLESLLARHWPEATRVLEFSSVTLLRALAHYGGPAELAKDPQASARLASWGGYWLRKEKIEKFLASAAQTVGVAQGPEEARRMQQYAAMALAARSETRKARGELKRLAVGNEVIQRQAKAVGIGTACVLWVMLGDPKDYPCGEAYRKAMGLNLKERSSGKYQGHVEDHQAWAVDRAAVDVLRRAAHGAIAVRQTLVRSQEGQGQGPRQRGFDCHRPQVGVGPARRRRARHTLRALAVVLAESLGSQTSSERSGGRRGVVQAAEERSCLEWGLRPQTPGIYRLMPIPEIKKNERGRTAPPPSPVLAPGAAHRVGSHRCPILRPGQTSIAHKSIPLRQTEKENNRSNLRRVTLGLSGHLP